MPPEAMASRVVVTSSTVSGRLPWAALFQPAIRLADEGFAISPRLNGLLGKEEVLRSNPLARAMAILAASECTTLPSTSWERNWWYMRPSLGWDDRDGSAHKR